MNYKKMKKSEIIEIAKKNNIELEPKMLKQEIIDSIHAHELSNNVKVTKNSSKLADGEVPKIDMKFDMEEEKAIESISDEIIEIARKNGNMIDDITVDVRLISELGSDYNKRAFAKIQKKLNSKNVEIEFTSDALQAVIADFSAIEEDINEEEINYSIETILKGTGARQDSDEVKNFLSSINDYPLLSKDKEIELGKVIALAHARIDNDEELDFFEREEYENARELLSLSNKRLVVSVAKKYINRGMDLIDLVMEGMLGLEKAIIKYNYETGFKFSTYATWWVRQGITRAIADKSKVIRVPVHMVETINKVTKIQRELTQKLGQEPTYEQIGKECNPKLSIDEIEHIFNIARDPIALEMPIGEDNSSLESFIEDDKHMTQSEESEKNELRRKLLEIIEEIPEREGEVLLYRYGLYDLDLEPVENKIEELSVILSDFKSDKINCIELEKLICNSKKLSPKLRSKYSKRIAQNNSKYEKKYNELIDLEFKNDKKNLERIKKVEKTLETISETNIKYIEKIIEISEEQLIILKKIDELTEGVVKALTLEEVGQLFEVTRERIRQIETKGKRKLKAFVDKEQLELFI